MADEKKKKSIDGVTIGGIALIAAVLLLGWDGGGFGSGGGLNISMPTQKNESVDSQTVVVEKHEATQPKIVTVDVTVSGRDYIYNNNRIGLQTLIGELEQYGKNVEIRITTDETATINAMDALTSKLAEEGFTNYSKR
mgnify:CR=1 FL=1|jgi:biopolymer transport protein ExbD